MGPRVLALEASDVLERLPALTALLQDAVASGGGIGFLPPVTDAQAAAFWRETAGEVAAGRRVLLGLVDEEDVLGTVQLAFTRLATAPHRAEVIKLMVHSRARRQGHARRLMRAAEDEARRRGRTLLVLDTFTGSAGDALYRSDGWHVVGEIPGYAIRPDGALGDLTLFWKRLG